MLIAFYIGNLIWGADQFFMNELNINELTQQFKQAIFDCYHTGQYQKGLEIVKEACKLEQHLDFFWSAAAAISIRLERWQDTIDYSLKAMALNPNDVNNLDALSHAYGALYDWHNAAKYGRAALEFRREMSRIDNPILPNLLPVNENIHTKKKIISFSLFGHRSAYIEPAVMNVQLVQAVYPGWICRFYVDESVPAQAIERLKSPYTEIIYVQGEAKNLPKTMWRFLAMDDNEAGYIIFRDADSVISYREATTVAEWMASGHRFHTIRDTGSHTELILAGLWGAFAGSIPNITQKMSEYIRQYGDVGRFSDQYFLRTVVWPYLQQDVYASDRIFGFMEAHPISDVDFDFSLTHIGCDEGGAIFRAENANFKKGLKVKWQLYSKLKLSPSFKKIPEIQDERLICEYETVAEDGYIKDHIPRRYADAAEQGLSRIEFIYE